MGGDRRNDDGYRGDRWHMGKLIDDLLSFWWYTWPVVAVMVLLTKLAAPALTWLVWG